MFRDIPEGGGPGPIEVPEEADAIEIDERNVRRIREMLNSDGVPQDPDALLTLVDSMLGHESLPPEEAAEQQYQAIKANLLAMATGNLAPAQTILNHALFLLNIVEEGRRG